jgi:hypothetical protein
MSFTRDSSRFANHSHAWRGMAVATVGLVSALCLPGLALAPPAAAASSSTVNQCNNVGPGAKGATTGMTCTVTVVNTIHRGHRSSTTTVTRKCSLAPCSPGDGTFTTKSTSLVTHVTQCNGSDNDSAHPITCVVNITNNIGRATHNAKPLSAATVNQCVGSGKGGGGTVNCDPHPASTTGATVTQCNGSGNGGGGTVHCTVSSASRISPAIPITVNQCNGTGNPGGSVVTCRTAITTHIIGQAPSPSPSPSPVPSASASPGPGPGPTPSGTPTAPGPVPQVPHVPRGGIGTGGGSTAGLQDQGVLGLGVALLLAAAGFGLLRWRMGRRS